VIAAITNCTNTSNPQVMLGAGLLAKKAVEAGLQPKPYVKTSHGAGIAGRDRVSRQGGLTPIPGGAALPHGWLRLHDLYRQTPATSRRRLRRRSRSTTPGRGGAERQPQLRGASQPLARANYLASPPLVVAYALAGTVDIDLATEPIGQNPSGQGRLPEGHLPTTPRSRRRSRTRSGPEMFRARYATSSKGERWQTLADPGVGPVRLRDSST